MTSCPNCGEPLASGQEYCLVCGARSGTSSRIARSSSGSGWALRALAAGVVAVVGAVAAVAATGSDGGRDAVITAIGGFVTAPASATDESPVGPSGVAEWPIDEDGWTIALASVPKTAGRATALARAKSARRKGSAAGRRPRLVALRKPPPGLLDRLLRRVLIRGGGNERARGCPRGVAHRRREACRPVSGRCPYGRRTCPDFVTTRKRRYTLRAKLRLRSFFGPVARNSGRSR